MKKIFTNILTAAILLCGALPMMAQNISLKGTVIDESSQPLPGTVVLVEGTTRGATTDTDGKFEIKVSQGETLVFDYLGFDTERVKVSGVNNIKVILKPSSESLDELVFVGYGTQKRVNVTGAVATVDYTDLSKSRPATTTSSLLQGASAGLYVAQTSGKPGDEGVSMRVRGVGTLNSGQDPLVIVDGFEGTIENVNPQDIASVSVLKDAASCAIYGNRGANGVILITTKNAIFKIPMITQTRLFWSQRLKFPDLLKN